MWGKPRGACEAVRRFGGAEMRKRDRTVERKKAQTDRDSGWRGGSRGPAQGGPDRNKRRQTANQKTHGEKQGVLGEKKLKYAPPGESNRTHHRQFATPLHRGPERDGAARRTGAELALIPH